MADSNDSTESTAADLLRLALQAEWLALMIEWELEHELRTPAGRARPFYGVRTPMQTKTEQRRSAREPVLSALAA